MTELVTVVDFAGSPRVGVDLFVSDVAGNIVETKKTDVAGSAELDIPVGGTLVYPVPLLPNVPTLVFAIVDPPQGEPVRVVEPPFGAPANTPKTLSFPWSGATHNETSIELALSCAPAVSFSAMTSGIRQAGSYKGCDGDGAFDAAFIGHNFAGTIVSSGVLSMPGSFAGATTLPTIPLVTSSPTIMDVAIASIPPESTDYDLELTASRNGRPLWAAAVSADNPSSNVNDTISVAAGLFDHFDVRHVLLFGVPGANKRRTMRQSSASLPASASWAPTTPPFPSTAPAPNLVTRTFHYGIDAGQLGDGVLLMVLQEPPASDSLLWIVLGKASGATVDVTLPALDGAFAGHSLQNLDTNIQTFHVAMEDRADFGDITANGLEVEFVVGFRGAGTSAVRIDEYLAQ